MVKKRLLDSSTGSAEVPVSRNPKRVAELPNTGPAVMMLLRHTPPVSAPSPPGEPLSVTPTLLPEIPDSGWQCSSIIDEIIDGTGLDKILRVQAQHAEEELAASIAAGKKIIDPGLRGFMHIAFLCHYHLAPIEQRNAIVAQFLAVRTDSQARAFVLEAKKYIRAHKLSNPASKPWQRHVSKQQERAE